MGALECDAFHRDTHLPLRDLVYDEVCCHALLGLSHFKGADDGINSLKYARSLLTQWATKRGEQAWAVEIRNSVAVTKLCYDRITDSRNVSI